MKKSGKWILFVLMLALVCLNANSPSRAQFYCDASELGDGGGEGDPDPDPEPPECYSDTYTYFHITGDSESCNGVYEYESFRVDVYQTYMLICNNVIISSSTTQVGTLCCNSAYCSNQN
jgi:hypothetical protein